ncbi:MAG: M23 family metallopeptidase [Chloroflexi bacterium]|nr:M23 family metallopeptidase [Chloroflexota bacterium]
MTNDVTTSPLIQAASWTEPVRETAPQTDASQATSFETMLLGQMMNLAGGSDSSSFGLGEMLLPLLLSLLEEMGTQELMPTKPNYGQFSFAAQPSHISPTSEGWMSQGYHPGHKAIDIALPEGNPIQTSMSGQVVHAGWSHQGYGNLVIVENGPYRTYYAHLSEIPVTVGQNVQAGQVIGLSGNTGNSTGPHLHYEIRLNGIPIDPTDYVMP